MSKWYRFPRSLVLPCHLTPFSDHTFFVYLVIFCAGSLTAACWFTYLLLFLRQMGLTLAQAGVVFLSGQLADAVSTPIAGVISDATTSGGRIDKFGRYKAFILGGAIGVTLFFGFVFPVYEASDMIKRFSVDAHVAFYSVAAALFNVSWATYQVNHLALAPKLSECDEDRVQCYALRNANTVLSNIIVFALFTLYSHVHSSIFDVWHRLALTVLCIGGGTMVAFLIGCREPAHRHVVRDRLLGASINNEESRPDPASLRSSAASRPDRRNSNSSTVSLLNETGDWKSWFKRRDFYTVGTVYMCSRLTVNVSQVYLVIFAVDSLGMGIISESLMPLALYLASYVANFVMKYLSTRVKLPTIFFVGAIMSVAALVALWFVAMGHKNWSFSDNVVYSAYALVPILGAGNSMMLVTALSMEARMVGNNGHSGGFVYGALSLTDKLSNGLAVFIINQLLPATAAPGEVGHVSPSFGMDLAYVFVLVPGIAAVVGTIASHVPTAYDVSQAQLADAAIRAARVSRERGIIHANDDIAGQAPSLDDLDASMLSNPSNISTL